MKDKKKKLKFRTRVKKNKNKSHQSFFNCQKDYFIENFGKNLLFQQLLQEK